MCGSGGVLWKLSDLGLLKDVDHLSAVSGIQKLRHLYSLRKRRFAPSEKRSKTRKESGKKTVALFKAAGTRRART